MAGVSQSGSVIWTRVLTVSVSTLGAIVGVTLLYIGAQFRGELEQLQEDFTGLNGLVHGMAVSYAESKTTLDDFISGGERYKDDHHKFATAISGCRENAAAFSARLDVIQDSLRKVGGRVDDLYTPGGPGKRFTSDEGARHERWIEQLRIDVAELRSEVRVLSQDCAALRGGKKK